MTDLERLIKIRDELKSQVDRMRRLGDYDANAAVIRQLAECSLDLTEIMIAYAVPRCAGLEIMTPLNAAQP